MCVCVCINLYQYTYISIHMHICIYRLYRVNPRYIDMYTYTYILCFVVSDHFCFPCQRVRDLEGTNAKKI